MWLIVPACGGEDADSDQRKSEPLCDNMSQKI